MTDQCNRCRFWQVDIKSAEFDDEPHSYGRCRRYPPKISDHMASISVGTPSFGQQYDPEDPADNISLYWAGLVPVTFCNDWCGEYASTRPEKPTC
ncbi:hypothetical protein [Sphingomonas immobilis]|uniref:Uncharacterized protein n=1 Tax=Sphingomonas immobilis TaxID=3063997 RepID=A0ABT9A0T3_9SPHN|nr:hypothetical protein [Sphingomonas sp. CA1-15]MDO7843430.1 hypothetical protein [Sphingomonas sp. CA1-15]